MFIKPQYKGVYGLIGYGYSNYSDFDLEYNGVRYGIGYELPLEWKHIFLDIIFDEDANDYRITTGARYYFESGF